MQNLSSLPWQTTHATMYGSRDVSYDVFVIYVVSYSCHMSRVGQNHIYTVYIRHFWQGTHQIYGHIRCIYTVLANPAHVLLQPYDMSLVVPNLQGRQLLRAFRLGGRVCFLCCLHFCDVSGSSLEPYKQSSCSRVMSVLVLAALLWPCKGRSAEQLQQSYERACARARSA